MIVSENIRSPPVVGPLLPEMADFAKDVHWAGNSWLPLNLQESMKEVVSGWTDQILYEMLSHRINVPAYVKWKMMPGISGGAMDQAKFLTVRMDWMNILSDYDPAKENLDTYIKNITSMKYHAEQLIGYAFCLCFLHLQWSVFC